MIRRILVPLDGSSRAENVLPHVLTIASVFKSRVELLHVLPGVGTQGRERLYDPLAYRLAQAERTTYLNAKAVEVRQSGVEVETSIQEGGAAEVIVDLLRTGAYDLVALTTHGGGCGKQLRIGCTAVAVILNARTSILLAPGDPIQAGASASGLRRASLESIVAPVDCSPRSDWSVTVAAQLARATGSRLGLVHVLGRPELTSRLPESADSTALVNRVLESNRREARRYLEQTAWRLKGTDLEVDERLVETSAGPADALHELVEAEEPDLLVLSAHGRGASAEWPLGGTAAKLIFWTRKPVLLLQDLPGQRERSKLAPASARAATELL